MADSTKLNVSRDYDKDQTLGIKLDSGPYIGIVKNNVDPARLGRISVYIPDLGGDQKSPTSWHIVTYASPYAGSTRGTGSGFDKFGAEKQSYGIWTTPPDLENQVLVTFVSGDRSRGYWFACIPTVDSRHMTPGMSSLTGDKLVLGPATDGLTGRGLNSQDVRLPASEVNLNSTAAGANADKQDYLSQPRVAHTVQSEVVIQQGLETDMVRGTITSSSQREAPSAVFGISSPGRESEDPADQNSNKQALDRQLSKKTIGEKSVRSRKGGHTFVMDDGDVYGDSNLVRVRTAGWHTILMHDTENIMYITNKEGNAYVELAPNGAVNVYSAKTFSVRSESDINFHSDANVNIQAGNSINCFAERNLEIQTQDKRERIANSHLVDVDNRYNLRVGGELKIQSGTLSGWTVTEGQLQLTGEFIHFNTPGAEIKVPDRVAPLEQYKQNDVRFDPGTKRWVTDNTSTLDSIASFTPTHEPWSRETGVLQRNNGTLKPSTKQQDI